MFNVGDLDYVYIYRLNKANPESTTPGNSQLFPNDIIRPKFQIRQMLSIPWFVK